MLTRKDLDGLKDLRAQTAEFVQRSYDWVSPLKQHNLLGYIYDFQNAINEEIQRLEEVKEDV